MQWDSAPPVCGAFTYGEVEDYTVQIGPSDNTLGVFVVFEETPSGFEAWTHANGISIELSLSDPAGGLIAWHTYATEWWAGSAPDSLMVYGQLVPPQTCSRVECMPTSIPTRANECWLG
jgi:hypothetical protein